MLSRISAQALKLAVLLLLLSAPSMATKFCVSATGNDANSGADCTNANAWLTPNHAMSLVGTTVNCGDIVEFKSGNIWSLPTLQAGVPISIGVNGMPAISCTAANPITFQVQGGDGICTQANPSACPIFVGGINVGATAVGWSRDHADPNFPLCQDDGTTCNLWVFSLTAASTQYFENLWYNNAGAGGLLRRFRSTLILKNNTNPQGQTTGTTNRSQTCVSGNPSNVSGVGTLSNANVNCGCAAGGVGGANCAVQAPPCSNSFATTFPWQCRDMFEYKTGNIDCTWHNIHLGAIHIKPIESWSMEDMRLFDKSPDGLQTSCSSGKAFITGATQPSPTTDSGFIPGNTYLAMNIREKLSVGGWYLDQCPTTANCSTSDATWKLYIAAKPGVEDPTVDDVWIPQMLPADTSVLHVVNSSGIVFKGLNFEMDNYTIPTGGLRDLEGMPAVPAMVNFTGTTAVTLEANIIDHSASWLFYSHGGGADWSNPLSAWTVQDNSMYDSWGGGFGWGDRGCNLAGNGNCTPDSNTNVPSFLTFQNNSIQYVHREESTGESTALYMGDGHNNLFTHNDCFYFYAGCAEFGKLLNRDANGPTQLTAGFMYGNTISWNRIKGQINGTGGTIGLNTDIGGIHSAANNSTLCPKTSGAPTGWPTPSNRAEFCNFIEYNWISDIATDPNNTSKHGAACIYPDQGSTYLWIHSNLCVRSSQDSIFQHNPGVAVPAPGQMLGQFAPSYNDYANNIFALAGALELPGRGRSFQYAAQNQNAATIHSNIFFINSTGGVGEAVLGPRGSSKWGAFDYTQTNPGSFPIPLTNMIVYDNNQYWDVGGLAFPISTFTCTAINTGCSLLVTNPTCIATPCYTNYTGFPWAADTGGAEDVHSTFDDPHFINPVYGATESWFPTNVAAMAKIGFTMWQYQQAGRFVNMLGNGQGAVFQAPAQAQNMPIRFIQASNYMPASYVPQTIYTYGNVGGTGHFTINAPAAVANCSLTIVPISATVTTLATQQFTPTFTNCSPATATWSVNGVIGGNSTIGTVSVTGLYTAPAAVPSPAAVTVTATSIADPTKIANAVVTILSSCTIGISPSSIVVQVNQTSQFTSTPSGCSPSTTIWSVNGIVGGNSVFGTVSTSGLYTAPATIPSPTTFTSLTANNTPQGAGFAGLTTAGGNTNAETQQVVPPALNDNVSTQDVHTLLYPATGGYTQEVACELQPWWGQGGHININQNDLDTAHISQKLNNMAARGCTSVWVDAYAINVNSGYEQNVLDLIANQLATGFPALKLVILYDQGSFDTSGTNWDSTPFTACPQGAVDETTCISNKMIQDYDQYNTRYFQKSYYLKSGGKPVVPVFITESLWSATNWTTIWSNVRTHTNTYVGGGIKNLFRNNSFSHTQSDGAFAWPQPTAWANGTPGTQFCWQEGDGSASCNAVTGIKPGGFAYLDDFYAGCLANPTKLCYGGFWKGFDYSNASWLVASPEIIAQQAGMAFLYTVDKFNSFFTVSAPVNGGVQFGTWDDYEEGTEVESGIDNTYRITASLVGNALAWTVTPQDVTYAQLRTIDHFDIWYQDGLGNMTLGGVVLSNTRTSISDISSLIPPGSFQVCVQAIGAPMMMNQMSNCMPYSLGAGTASPATVVVTATSGANPGVFSRANVSITSTSTGENAYETIGDVPTFAAMDGPAHLPTRGFYTGRDATVTGFHTDGNPSTTWTVSTLAQWQTAQTGAVCGDVIQLAAGVTINGSLTTPGLTCDSSHWILITVANWGTAGPPEGVRVTPCWWGVSSLAAGVGGAGGRPALNCASTAHRGATIIGPTVTANNIITLTVPASTQYMRIQGIEVTRPTGGAFAQTQLMKLSNTNTNHVILDQMWIHGTTNDETQRVTSLDNCTYCAVVSSFVNDLHCIASTGQCGDSQAFSGGINPNMAATDGAWKIYNNYLESAAETIELGGGSADSFVPCDLEYRNNFMFKPLFWDPSPANASYAPPNGGANPFGVKNHWETKNSCRVLIEGNVMQNNWTQGQTGNSITITPKSQVVSGDGKCPSCKTTDITVRYNRINTVNQPFQVGDSLSNPCTTNCAALAGNSYSIHDNVADNIGSTISNSGSPTSTIQGSSPTPNPGATFFLHDQTYNHNTFVYAAVTSAGTWPTGLDNVDGPCVNDGTNCTGGAIQFNKVVTNNIFYAGQSGFLVTGAAIPRCSTSPSQSMTNGGAWFNACYLTSTWDYNCVVGGVHTGWTWPGTHNQLLANAVSNVQFTNYNSGNGGNYALATGSPCHNTASDGKDMGADIPTVSAFTNGVDTF